MPGIALVTGGSSGIGAATCRLLGKMGWSVAINYQFRREEAEAIVAEIKEGGGQAIAIQADVACEADIVGMFETVDRELGQLTGLVNCAGIAGKRGRFEHMEGGDLRRIMEINVLGSMLCSLQAIRRMSTRQGGRGGSIVNLSSGVANTGGALAGYPIFLPDRPGLPSSACAPYAATKGAINAFTLALSQEVAREGIRVNAVSPGSTISNMSDPGLLAEIRETIPIGRSAESSEIAEAIVWLMSDKASYVAGAYLRVGGGRLG